MIWESTFLMTVIDVLIVSATCVSVWLFAKNRKVFARADVMFGVSMIMTGLAFIGLLYFIDLLTMYGLPAFIGTAAALAVMEDLHLNHSWGYILLASACICVGFASATHKLVPLANRLQFAQFAVNRSPDSICWMTPDARLFYVNDSACRTLGYTREELLSMSVHDIDPDFPAEVWPGLWERLRDCGALSLKGHHRTKRGQVFPVEIKANFIRFDGQEFTCAVARDITERVQAEASQHLLLRKVITAQEEERQRVARELHDEVGQSLTSLLVGLQVLKSLNSLTELRGHADSLRKIVQSTLKETQRLALGLRPSVLDDQGLEAAVRHYVKEFSVANQIKAKVIAEGVDGHLLSPAAATALYRIVQEALTNAVKHSGASTVSVLLTRGASQVRLIVEDNGKGFDVRSTVDAQGEKRALGLIGMRERLALLNGTFSIESSRASGTTIYADVPLERA